MQADDGIDPADLALVEELAARLAGATADALPDLVDALPRSQLALLYRLHYGMEPRASRAAMVEELTELLVDRAPARPVQLAAPPPAPRPAPAVKAAEPPRAPAAPATDPDEDDDPAPRCARPNIPRAQRRCPCCGRSVRTYSEPCSDCRTCKPRIDGPYTPAGLCPRTRTVPGARPVTIAEVEAQLQRPRQPAPAPDGTKTSEPPKSPPPSHHLLF